MSEALAEVVKVEKALLEIAQEFAIKASSLRVPFIVIIGAPTGNTIGLSKGLDDPDINNQFVQEVVRYAEFMAGGGSKN